MHIYVLDSLLRRSSLLDKFVSCIWTERANAYGDVTLTVFSTADNRRLFTKGTLLACNESMYVMRIDTIENTVNDDGASVINISGTSIERLLDDRVAMGALSDLTTSPNWTITDVPAAVARKIFHDICITGILNVADIIPFVVEGTVLPESTIAEPIDSITVELTPQSVYSAIKDICDTYSLGFRILRNGDSSQLYFDIFAGSDRTTKQTELPAVVFSPELDTLQNTTELTSSANYKNIAYVFSPAGYLTVYPQDVDPDTAGFERRVMFVDASDVTTDTTDIPAALYQKGIEALAAQRSFTAFDGEVSERSPYRYGVDYFLGDLVEMRNVDGVVNFMRVTEQIFVSDAEGERSYPTLTVYLFVDAGTWLSFEAARKWVDMGATEYWANA